MAFGLQVENPLGNLVVSTEGFGANYIGKASYLSDVQAFTPVGGAGTYTNHKKYRITTTTSAIAVFLKLTSNKCGVTEIVHSGDNWDITVFNEGAGGGTYGFGTQAAADVYCFARPTSTSAYGLALYDGAGNLAYDIGGPQPPLFFKHRLAMAANVNSAAMPSGYTTPAFLICSAGFNDPAQVLIDAGLGRYRADAYVYGVALSGGNIVRQSAKVRYGEVADYGAESPPTGDEPAAVSLYLIEAGGLT
jgi:hypothetical protein